VAVHRFRTGATRAAAMRRMLNPAPALAVWREVRELRPDVVHLFNGEGSPWSLLWASLARRDGVPFVVTAHDPEPHPGEWMEALHAHLGRLVWRRAGRVHVHSGQFLPELRRRGVGAERVQVIPHGSFAARFLAHRRGGVQTEQLALLVGRMAPYKGLDLLVDAGLLLGEPWRVAVAGGGRIPRGLLDRIRARPDVFELHNRPLEDEEIAVLFQRARVCVLPYRHATQSSLPLVAAGFGVPVAATAVGAFVEDVPRVNGLLVPPGDPSALARGIRAAARLEPVHPHELEFPALAADFMSLYARCGAAPWRPTSVGLATSLPASALTAIPLTTVP
jgi:glycosyltransferase involved in cell wall biosynthesis